MTQDEKLERTSRLIGEFVLGCMTGIISHEAAGGWSWLIVGAGVVGLLSWATYTILTDNGLS
jgi:hypothetical protein